ncbi:MAG: hypothetical protein IJH76_07085 [Clostridia bacterium]|nr:hypothetical protein [Clostridia bacterium]
MKKRKQNTNKQFPKKTVIYISVFILLFAILIFLSTTVFARVANKLACEKDFEDFTQKNQKTIFSIDKCVLFSNCNVSNKDGLVTNLKIDDLFQYTDIALFINNNSNENTLENTLKSVKIDNIEFTTKPSVGEQKLYYKNINSFAEGIIPSEDNLIEKDLDFSISSKDNENLNTPTLYNNCANPITLSYVNDKIKTDYGISNVSGSITYDGSLLKMCNVMLSSLNAKISFDIYITNNLNQEFKCSVFIDIPVEKDGKSLYDGAISKEEKSNFKFIRIK